MKKKWKVPVSWEMCGIAEIEAETLEDALEQVQYHLDEVPLPDDSAYVDGSFSLSMYEVEEIRKIYNNNRPDQEENCVYMVQFDWSVEDDSGNDIYLYDTYEKALEKYQSIIASEMDPNQSWVGDQAFDNDGNVNEDYDFQRTDNPNTEYHCWYVENTAESSWYSKVKLTKKIVE